MSGREDKARRYGQLQAKYGRQLCQRIRQLQDSLATLAEAGTAESLEDFRRQVHSLSGSAGSFGYHRLGEKAREFEAYLFELDLPGFSDKGIQAELGSHLKELENIAGEEPDTSQSARSSAQSKLPSVSSRRIFVLEDDEVLAEELVAQLLHFGYQAESFGSAREIEARTSQEMPAALIADLSLPEGELEGPRLASKMRKLSQDDIPAIFISARDDWSARLASVRAGGQAYFAKPLDFAALIDQLDCLMGSQETKPYRILIVEDMELLAQHYAEVLEGVGMQVKIVTDPGELLEHLSAFRPELVLMDLYMPDCNGTEAAQVIRQHSSYRNLPIVYLSTEAALGEQLAALRVGGDDFLQKPISDSHLQAAVEIRVRRFRELAASISRDGLTGLLNHINLKLALEHELAERARDGGRLCFAMIDIDEFKAINDRYGHPVGDRVIKGLARLLSQRLRKSDIVGRYGGEEFGVILPATTVDSAAELLDELRETFGQISYAQGQETFHASFSAGIASTLDFPIWIA